MEKIGKFFEGKKNVIKTKTKKLFSVENNSKSFIKKKKMYRKNAKRFEDINTLGFRSTRENACPTGGSLL